MSNNKQSSIEFIIECLMSRNLFTKELLEEFDHAFELYREEQAKTWDDAIENMKARGGNDMRAWADFDDYYNEKFGGNNEQH